MSQKEDKFPPRRKIHQRFTQYAVEQKVPKSHGATRHAEGFVRKYQEAWGSQIEADIGGLLLKGILEMYKHLKTAIKMSKAWKNSTGEMDYRGLDNGAKI